MQDISEYPNAWIVKGVPLNHRRVAKEGLALAIADYATIFRLSMVWLDGGNVTISLVPDEFRGD